MTSWGVDRHVLEYCRRWLSTLVEFGSRDGWILDGWSGKGVELLVKGGYHLGHRTNTVRAS
jgi:hypothetical protein